MKDLRLFVAIQFIATGLIESGVIVDNMILPKDKIKNKGARRTLDVFTTLKNKLDKSKLDKIEKQYEALMTRMQFWEETKMWSPILSGLDLAREFIHPSSIDKTINLIKGEDDFRYMDKHILNSLIIAQRIREKV